MSNDFVRQNTADEDKRVDAEKITVGGVDVFRKRISAGGSQNFATGQVDVTSSATQIVGTRDDRKSVLVVNHGTNAVYVGGAGVTALTGLRIAPQDGAGVVIPTAAALYGITSGPTQTVSFLETF